MKIVVKVGAGLPGSISNEKAYSVVNGILANGRRQMTSGNRRTLIPSFN